MKAPNQTTLHKLWLSLIIIGSLIRIFVCFQHNPLDYLFSDPKRHWVNGAHLFSPNVMGGCDPIFYQVYVYVLRIITADNRYLIALTSSLLSVLMPWTFYRAGRTLGMNKNAALGAWGLIACLPSLFTIYHYIMMETVLLPLIGIALWMTGRFLKHGNCQTWLISVFTWTLVVLTKPTAAPIAAVCLAYSWWQYKRCLLYLVSGGILGIAMLIPNAVRTYHVLGFSAPLGNPWVTKIQHHSNARKIRIEFSSTKLTFTSPSIAIQPLSPLSPWRMKRATEDTEIFVKIDPNHGERDWKEIYKNISISSKEWWGQLSENLLLFLFAPSWPDGTYKEWDGWLSYQLRWLWAPLIFFLLARNIRSFLEKEFHLIPLAMVALTLFLAFQNIATFEGRYRKPLEPLLILNLVWTLSNASTKKRDEKS